MVDKAEAENARAKKQLCEFTALFAEEQRNKAVGPHPVATTAPSKIEISLDEADLVVGTWSISAPEALLQACGGN